LMSMRSATIMAETENCCGCISGFPSRRELRLPVLLDARRRIGDGDQRIAGPAVLGRFAMLIPVPEWQ
jgi:hypothetical protein